MLHRVASVYGQPIEYTRRRPFVLTLLSFYWLRDDDRMRALMAEGDRIDLAGKAAVAVLSPKDFKGIDTAWRRRAGIFRGDVQHAKRNVKRLLEAAARAQRARSATAPEAG